MRTDYIQQFVKLRRELLGEKGSLEQRLSQINDALGEVATVPARILTAPAEKPQTSGKRQMSPQARARIAAAQRKRWAVLRDGQSKKLAVHPAARPKPRFSPAARKRLAEVARKRWAAAKAAGKSAL